MKIASVDVDGRRRYGRVEGSSLVLLQQEQDPLVLLDADQRRGLRWGETVPFDESGVLHPPLPVTTLRDFITFEQHTAGSLRAVRGTSEVPEAWFRAPAFYFTNPYAAVGSGQEVPVPPGCHAFDFELEVGVVISKDGFNVSVEEAWDHVGGFTIFNDWSARDLQQDEMGVGLGPAKGKDTASTLGPVVVTLDELEAYRRGGRYDLAMEVTVNGERIGGDTLANMAWSFADLIAYASRGTWVRRGDILGSGTCGGGCLAEFWGWAGEQSPAPLGVGDEVAMTVEGIGTIRNVVVQGPEAHPVHAAARVPWEAPPLP